MDIHVSLTDGVPIYQQIVNQVKYLVAAGRLRAGAELPTIRALAESLQVNPNTVARAYRELEREGTVEKRSTKGTFVADQVSRFSSSHRQAALNGRIDQLLAESKQLGFTLTQLIDHVRLRAKVMTQVGESNRPASKKRTRNRILDSQEKTQ